MEPVIHLTRGLSTLVDLEDYEWLARDRWYACAQGYAVRWLHKSEGCPQGAHVQVRMATAILQHHGRCIVGAQAADHRNADRLDNRKVNLRAVTSRQNARNMRSHTDSSSRFKGVSWETARKRWAAHIWDGQRKHYLGRFEDELAAAAAYDEAARRLFGPDARPNHGPLPISGLLIRGIA